MHPCPDGQLSSCVTLCPYFPRSPALFRYGQTDFPVMNASTTLPLTTLTEPAAPDAETQFAAVIEFSDDAIIGKTPEGIITSWSSSAEKIFGYSAAEIIGQPGVRLIPPDRLHEERPILARVARGEGINEFENVRVDEGYPGRPANAAPGAYVRLDVTDTGTGVPAENIDKIFDPFFTTKELGQATGLGLSTVLGIVKSHGGFVTLQSEVGRGSTFRIHLPALPDSEEATEAGAETPPPRGHNEMVLIVDDEDPIRNLAATHLSHHGHQVVSAGNGVEALARFAEHPDQIKLVVTDCDMPVMDGVNLIKLLRSSNPDLRIIVSTGFQSAMRVETRSLALDQLANITYLPKPYTSNQLLSAVHGVLASAPHSSPKAKHEAAMPT